MKKTVVAVLTLALALMLATPAFAAGRKHRHHRHHKPHSVASQVNR